MSFLSSASNTTVYAEALGLVAVGLVLLLIGLRLRPEPPPPEATAPTAAKKPAPAPAPVPKGYRILKTGKEPEAAANQIIVGAPAEWGGSGPIPVDLDGAEKRAAAEPKKPGPVGPVLRVVGSIVLAVGLLVSVVAVQRVREHPPTDVTVELPSTLLALAKTHDSVTSKDAGLLDRAGHAYDQRAAGTYGSRGTVHVSAERVTVKDPAKAVRSYDGLGKGFVVAPGPLGGAAKCYPVTTPGFVCVLINHSSVVIVSDTGKRPVASAAARARAIRGRVVTKS